MADIRVFDSFMIDALQDIGKSLTDFIYIPQGKRRVRKLSVFQFTADKTFNKLIDCLRRGGFHGAHSSFYGISQHNDSSFLGIRFRTRIPEFINIYLLPV